MELYLVIITTVLVLTQIIRVVQNAMSLGRNSEIDRHNDELMEIFRDLSEDVADIKECIGGEMKHENK